MKHIALGVLLATTSATTIAQSSITAELLLGTADQEASINGFVTAGDDTSTGIRGAFNINENFALELAHFDYGTISQDFVFNSESINVTSTNLGVKGGIPFENGFSIYTRIGIAFWDWETTVTFPSVPDAAFRISDDGNELYYGFGAQFEFTPNVIGGIEYTVTSFDVSNAEYELTLDHEVENLALSLGLKF